MAMTHTDADKFQKAIMGEGFEAAVRLRDARKAELEETREWLLQELESVNGQLALLQKDFARAARQVLATAGHSPAGRGIFPGRTYAQWVTEALSDQGGVAFGPDLYDRWQHETSDYSGKNRLKIQSVVSQLIRQGTVRKARPAEMPDVPTSGRKGSVLVLTAAEPRAGGRKGKSHAGR